MSAILQTARFLQIVRARTKLMETLQIKTKRAHQAVQLPTKHRLMQPATQLPTKHKLMQLAAALRIIKLSPTQPTSLLETPLTRYPLKIPRISPAT